MELLTETYLKLGFAGALIVVFLYLYIYKTKESSKQSKKANETITEINQKIFNAFMNEIKSMAEASHENKKLNKDSMVILAQMQKVLLEHDKYSRESWEKILKLLNEMCETMNGSNPAIKKLQDKITDLHKVIDNK
jgi:cell shape-determining protein MreC